MPDAVLSHLSSYRWPGNIRELENVIERLVVLATCGQIVVLDLPEYLRREHPSVDVLNLEMPPQGISLEAVERELMLRALQKHNWNQTHAAKYLDISRKALMYRMEKHGIEKPATAPGDDEDRELPQIS